MTPTGQKLILKMECLESVQGPLPVGILASGGDRGSVLLTVVMSLDLAGRHPYHIFSVFG